MPGALGKRAAGGVEQPKPHSAGKPDPSLGDNAQACSVARDNEEQAVERDNEASDILEAETRWWMKVNIGDFCIRALYDPGASRTVMGAVAIQLATACKREIEVYVGKGAKVADGRVTPIAGHVTLPFEVAGVVRDVKVAIIKDLDADCYLGANFIRIFQTIHDPTKDQLEVKIAGKTVDLEVAAVSATEVTTLAAIGLADMSASEEAALERMLNETLPEVEEPLGCTTLVEHEIDVGDTKPIKQKHYPVSPVIEEVMHAEVQKMLDEGIVEESSSGWSSPVVMVRKEDGSRRFCINFRKVNAVTKSPDAYPMPFSNRVQSKLKKAKYFSAVDVKSAYHNIPLKKESKPITAFTVPGRGLYQFTRMPFGLRDAGATFQRLIEKVIGEDLAEYAFPYIDDICVMTEDFETHKRVLRELLIRLKKAGLTVNRKKSKFCQSEVKYLGVLVSRDGVRPCREKIEAILDYPAPKNRKQLKRFLGMASWYRKFLKNHAMIAEPLTRLTSARVSYVWGEEQQEAFDRVLVLLSSAPMLAGPDFSKQFVIHADASDTGIGACITQTVDGEERVIEFFSRVLNKAQTKLQRDRA